MWCCTSTHDLRHLVLVYLIYTWFHECPGYHECLHSTPRCVVLHLHVWPRPSGAVWTYRERSRSNDFAIAVHHELLFQWVSNYGVHFQPVTNVRILHLVCVTLCRDLVPGDPVIGIWLDSLSMHIVLRHFMRPCLSWSLELVPLRLVHELRTT